nr:MAG TPA: hypothetical protein [Inoviridae sp.]
MELYDSVSLVWDFVVEHPVLALLTMFFTLLAFILVHKMMRDDEEKN